MGNGFKDSNGKFRPTDKKNVISYAQFFKKLPNDKKRIVMSTVLGFPPEHIDTGGFTYSMFEKDEKEIADLVMNDMKKCPKCNSDNTYDSIWSKKSDGKIYSIGWKCNDCGNWFNLPSNDSFESVHT